MIMFYWYTRFKSQLFYYDDKTKLRNYRQENARLLFYKFKRPIKKIEIQKVI